MPKCNFIAYGWHSSLSGLRIQWILVLNASIVSVCSHNVETYLLTVIQQPSMQNISNYSCEIS